MEKGRQHQELPTWVALADLRARETACMVLRPDGRSGAEHSLDTIGGHMKTRGLRHVGKGDAVTGVGPGNRAALHIKMGLHRTTGR